MSREDIAGKMEGLQNGLQTTVIRSIEDIETIRSVWEKMQSNAPYPTVNTDIDRYIGVLEANPDKLQPYVMVMKQAGQPVGMVIGWLEKHPVKIKLGYKTMLSPTLSCLTVVYGGVLTNGSSMYYSSLMISELMRVIKNHEANLVFINHIKVDSDLYQFAHKAPGLLTRDHFPKVEPHWVMTIPDNIEHFYQARSKKHRGNLRRSMKKLETEYQNEVKIMSFNKQNDLEQGLDIACSISAGTYQRALGAGFVNDHRTHELLSIAAQRGWLRFSVLFVRKEPCAFQYGLVYKGNYFLQQIGFNPNWKKLNVGTVLFLKVLELLIAESNIKLFDFGFGDAPYKQSYSDVKWEEASVYIFAPRIQPILLNLLQMTMTFISQISRYSLQKSGFLALLKRHWRNKLQNDDKY